MNKKEEPKRGGGVKLATRFTKTSVVINKNGDVIKTTVEKPGEKRQMRPIRGGISERLR